MEIVPGNIFKNLVLHILCAKINKEQDWFKLL